MLMQAGPLSTPGESIRHWGIKQAAGSGAPHRQLHPSQHAALVQTAPIAHCIGPPVRGRAAQDQIFQHGALLLHENASQMDFAKGAEAAASLAPDLTHEAANINASLAAAPVL